MLIFCFWFILGHLLEREQKVKISCLVCCRCILWSSIGYTTNRIFKLVLLFSTTGINFKKHIIIFLHPHCACKSQLYIEVPANCQLQCDIINPLIGGMCYQYCIFPSTRPGVFWGSIYVPFCFYWIWHWCFWLVDNFKMWSKWN